jgi:hypothetical protein
MSFFPLPLVAFEHYMLADDRLAYPMSFFFRLKFTGRFDRCRFHEALRESLTRHPLLHAHIRGSAEGETSGLTWMDAPDLDLLVSWNLENSPVLFPEGQQIDLRRETGIRLWAHEGSETTFILLQFHHSCSDGIGATHFIESLLTAYAKAPGWLPQHSSNVSAGRSLHRARGRLGLNFLEMGRRLCSEIPRIASFFLTTPLPVVGRLSAKADTRALADFPGLLSHSFEETESGQICSMAKRNKVTVNDLLLRDLFVTLDGWNRLHTPGRYAGSLRISMPMNLRPSADMSMPAVNAMSMVFLDRHSSGIADPETLLHGIQAETQAMKQGHLGLTLLWVLRIVGAFPGGLKALLGGIRCLNSSVLSNLGIMFADSPLRGPGDLVVANDIILESVEFFPPVRPLTHASFGVVSYGKRLVVGMNYDRLTLTSEDAHELLGAFAGQVKLSIN